MTVLAGLMLDDDDVIIRLIAVAMVMLWLQVCATRCPLIVCVDRRRNGNSDTGDVCDAGSDKMLHQATTIDLSHAGVIEKSISFSKTRERRHVPRSSVQLGT